MAHLLAVSTYRFATATACGWFLLLAILLPSSLLANEISRMEPTAGHTAAWYNPDRDGEGWVLEVLNEQRAVLYWYTYDEQGGQRWLIGEGTVKVTAEGPMIDFPELLSARGGRLGGRFDPNEIEYQSVGQATLTFSDCHRGEFEHNAFGQAANVAVQRLSRTMASTCDPIHGVPGDTNDSRAGQSGSWMSRQGEGLSMMWLADDRALLTWFSYDAEGDPKWLIGLGTAEGEQILFPQVQTTSGARFGEDFASDDVVINDWGSLTLNLSCSTGTASYETAQTSDEFDLKRLTIPARLNCPWQVPSLSDLYDIEWQPLSWDTDEFPGGVRTTSIADDLTVAAIARDPETDFDSLALLPHGGDWELHPFDVPIDMPIISRDARQVFASVSINQVPPPGTTLRPLAWQRETGWRDLAGLVLNENFILGVSQDRSQLVGYGSAPADREFHSWIWNDHDGQQPLAGTQSFEGGQAFTLAVANKGQAAVGELVLNYSFTRMDVFGFRHIGDSQYERLYSPDGEPLGQATHCDNDCQLVVGSNVNSGFMGWIPERRESWFWSEDGRFGYLGVLPGYGHQAEQEFPVIPQAISADGSLIVGRYGNGSASNNGFVWSPLTGAVSIRELAQALDVWQGQEGWQRIEPVAITSRGDAVLLHGSIRDESGVIRQAAAILRLHPR